MTREETHPLPARNYKGESKSEREELRFGPRSWATEWIKGKPCAKQNYVIHYNRMKEPTLFPASPQTFLPRLTLLPAWATPGCDSHSVANWRRPQSLQAKTLLKAPKSLTLSPKIQSLQWLACRWLCPLDLVLWEKLVLYIEVYLL